MNRFASWDGWTRLAAVAGVLTLWFTAQSLIATQKQVQLTERGQFTDHYARAVDQIGSQSAATRTAGVDTLVSLARLFPAEAERVERTLKGHVRNRVDDLACGRENKLVGEGAGQDVRLAASNLVGNFSQDLEIDVWCLVRDPAGRSVVTWRTRANYRAIDPISVEISNGLASVSMSLELGEGSVAASVDVDGDSIDPKFQGQDDELNIAIVMLGEFPGQQYPVLMGGQFYRTTIR